MRACSLLSHQLEGLTAAILGLQGGADPGMTASDLTGIAASVLHEAHIASADQRPSFANLSIAISALAELVRDHGRPGDATAQMLAVVASSLPQAICHPYPYRYDPLSDTSALAAQWLRWLRGTSSATGNSPPLVPTPAAPRRQRRS